MRGQHAAPRPARTVRLGRLDPLWLVVGLGAAAVRVALGLSVGLAPYSGDSWCLLHLGTADFCASHPPTITRIWRLFTFGTFTQGSVLLLQGVLGVLGALLLFALLRRVANRWVAAVAALLVSAVPVELFMERVIMAEAVETFVLLVGLWLGMWALRAPRRLDALWRICAASFVLGMGAAMHAAIALTVVTLTVLLVVLVVWRQVSEHTTGSVISLLLAPLLAAVVLVAPSIPMALRYQSTFGTLSTHAMAGTYLAASWAPLLSCPAPAGSQPAVEAFYREACTHRGFGDPPGVVAKLMWAPGLEFLRTAPDPNERAAFASAQSALAAAALSGIAHHPGGFLAEVGRSLWFQMTARASTRALHVYNTGRSQWEQAQAETGPTAAAVRQWFGRAVPSTTRPSPDLGTAVRMTDWLPQAVLCLTILAGLVRLVVAGGRRLRRRPRWSPSSWLRPPSDRVCLGLFATALVFTGMLAWAVGSWPIFRLWSPLVPAVAILAVLAVPRRRSAPDTPEAAGGSETPETSAADQPPASVETAELISG